jgi:hypothetical protein
VQGVGRLTGRSPLSVCQGGPSVRSRPDRLAILRGTPGAASRSSWVWDGFLRCCSAAAASRKHHDRIVVGLGADADHDPQNRIEVEAFEIVDVFAAPWSRLDETPHEGILSR